MIETFLDALGSAAAVWLSYAIGGLAWAAFVFGLAWVSWLVDDWADDGGRGQ